jgi:hypothetical protein
LIVIKFFYEPVYYDHTAIVTVTIVDAAIIVVAIVNPVPVPATIAKATVFLAATFI